VFYVRDETLGEDRSRIRTRSGPQVMAALRNAALSLLRMTGSTNISASLRDYSWNIQLVKNLLAIV
jgi:predicted transposase YbfD/YdcC